MSTENADLVLPVERIHATTLARARWRTLALLLLAIMIIAADKSVFAFAGPQIMQDLHLTPTQFGFLGGAFFLLYSISGVGVGLLTNRFQARWILLGLAMIWAFCQCGIAVGTGLVSLVFFRMLLGFGAGPSTAVIQHACLQWFPSHKQVLPASGINAGLMAGILVSALLLPWLISHHGWRVAYLVLGGISGLWALSWTVLGREGRSVMRGNPAQAEDHSRDWVPYRYLMLNRTFVGMTGLSFVGYMASGLGFSWLPTYLQKALGYSPTQVGIVVMITMAFVIPTVLVVSSLSQRWLKHGCLYATAMVWLPVSCCLLGGACYLAMDLHHLPVLVKTVLVGTGFVLLNVQQSYGITVVGGISTPRQRGSLIAIHVALTTIAGVIAPVLAGYLVKLANNSIGQGFECCLALIGLFTLVVGIGCLRWVRPDRTRDALTAFRIDKPVHA